jgi:tetratricopeptide (TPR) repeat protein
MGLCGMLFTGCATTPHGAGAAHSDSSPSAAITGTLPTPKGNPDALAHYAAGVSLELNDLDAQAVKQFDAAALDDPSNEALVIKVAERFIKNKEWDKAVAVLAKSARRRDASAMVISWLARADLQAGKTSQAMAASRRAIERAPGAFDGYESQIEILFRASNMPEAVKTLNRAAKALRPDPSTLVALSGLYTIYLKAVPKDSATRSNAVALLDRVARMKVSSEHLWQTVADTYAMLDQPQKAAAIYQKLLSAAEDSSAQRDGYHEKLAGIYFRLEDKTNATKQLQAIVHDNPTRYPRAWFYLGELAYDSENLEEAADDYENALQWDPSIEDAWFKLVLVKIDLHRGEEALRTLDAARGKFGKTYVCELYTAIAYLHLKNYSEAIHHFNEAEVIALATEPAVLDYRFYFQFGEACERNQEFKQAAEYLQKSIDLSPDFSEALNYLGYMLADRGEQLPRARSLIERAVHLEPKNGAFLDSLGWVLFKERQPGQALPWLLRATAISPEPDATVLDHLGEVYMALHQPGKAIEAWKKSFSIESNPEVKKKLDSYSGGA